MKHKYLSILASIGFGVILGGPSLAFAQTLGNAINYAVLGGTAVTVAGPGATITGELGVSPGSSITGSPTMTSPYTTHANDASAVSAQTSATALFTELNSGAPDSTLLAELGGTSVGPGTYLFSSTANIAAGTTLTLNGAGTYIFRVTSAITANVNSNVVLSGGASACNVFWRVGSAATLNGTNFFGTVVANNGITLGSSATLTGRALNLAPGPVTMAGSNTVTIAGCGSSSSSSSGGDSANGLSVSKRFTPATIGTGGFSLLTLTLGNTNSAPITLTANFTDSLPSGMMNASTPTVSTTCGGTAIATPSGSSVGLPSGSTIPAGGCTVTVYVTGAATGTYTNTLPIGSLVTSGGSNSSGSSAVLTISPDIAPGTPAIPEGVPALPGWAFLTLVALMALAGFTAMRRRVA